MGHCYASTTALYTSVSSGEPAAVVELKPGLRPERARILDED